MSAKQNLDTVSDARDVRLACGTILAQWHADDVERFHEDLGTALADAQSRHFVRETVDDCADYAYAARATKKGRELRVYWGAKQAAAEEFSEVINADVNSRAYDRAAYERLCRRWAIFVCAIFDESPPYSEGRYITASDYPPVIDEAFAKRKKGGE